MIFSRTIDLVLAGKKDCTTRLQYFGDVFVPNVVVKRSNGKVRWRVGGIYAVQRERCHSSEGSIRIDRIEPVVDPLNVSLEVARAEGFDSVSEYQKVWRSLHKSEPIQLCWRLWFTLIHRKDRT